jgi:hypothetical protein
MIFAASKMFPGTVFENCIMVSFMLESNSCPKLFLRFLKTGTQGGLEALLKNMRCRVAGMQYVDILFTKAKKKMPRPVFLGDGCHAQPIKINIFVYKTCFMD